MVQIVEQLETIRGVKKAEFVEPSPDVMKKTAGIWFALLSDAGKQMAAQTGLGDLLHVVWKTDQTREMILPYRGKLLVMTLAENVSPLMVSKQAHTILEQA